MMMACSVGVAMLLTLSFLGDIFQSFFDMFRRRILIGCWERFGLSVCDEV